MPLPKHTIPFTAGTVVGAVAISILSLANGWMVTSQKMDTEMQKANISVQASICAARADTFLKESNNTENLEGYRAEVREKREELARANVTPLMDDDASTSSVINACATMLNKPNA